MKYRDGILHIGGISAPDLVARFGTPLYVYDAAVIRRQIERLALAFAPLAPRLFYAMKANGNIAILRIMREAGLGCDAVSPGEIFIARRAGFTGVDTWFTCSNVSDDDLRAIDDPTLLINVNAMSDLDRIVRLGLKNPIGLRVNTEVGEGHHADVVTAGYGVKFGFDIAEIGDARMIAEDAGLNVVGLHAHIGSGIRRSEPLVESARTLMEISETFPKLEFVNFGGGIAVPYQPGDREFPINDYGRHIAGLAGPRLAARGVRAILEPGRFLVAEAGTLLATVTSRRISGGYDWLGCDTGFNHLVRPSKYGAYHHILNASRGDDSMLREHVHTIDETTPGVIVAGNLCESGDVFTRDTEGPLPRQLPPIKVDDILAFCDAGAYGFSMSSNYNGRVLPAEVLIDGGEARVVRRRETFDELMRGM
ncbi:MAG: diaminopimelate decarboxylase [Thermoanaerobaculia bacterium]